MLVAHKVFALASDLPLLLLFRFLPFLFFFFLPFLFFLFLPFLFFLFFPFLFFLFRLFLFFLFFVFLFFLFFFFLLIFLPFLLFFFFDIASGSASFSVSMFSSSIMSVFSVSTSSFSWSFPAESEIRANPTNKKRTNLFIILVLLFGLGSELISH